MQGPHTQPGGWLGYAVAIVVVAVVLALRMRRMRRVRRLRPGRLWIVPALYLVVVAMLFAQHPPTAAGWLSAAVALIAGGALGWQRGKLMRIHLDPESNALNQQASMAGMAFLVVLIVARYAARAAGGGAHLGVAMVVDTLAALALGMFTVQRIEMYLRARRLLAAARGGQ